MGYGPLLRQTLDSTRPNDLQYNFRRTICLPVAMVMLQRRPAVVGCLQFSSAAWRMRARDEWIGWDDATRARHLPRVVSNSRFLLAPWVRIRNLASAALSLALRRLPEDWQARYAQAVPILQHGGMRL
jgi:hypothetical protein